MFGFARALNAWRRLALMARLRLKAFASRSELEMSLAPGCRIGKGVRISLQGRRNKITLGRGAHLGERVSIELRNGELFLGDRCEIRAESVAHISGRLYLEEACGFSIRCVIHCGQNIEIGKNTIFGEYCSVLDGEHVHTQSDEYHFYLDPRAQNILASVKIGKGVYIGAKATIVRGAEIGDFCRIGANAVVTGKIEPHTLAVGVPARPVKKLV